MTTIPVKRDLNGILLLDKPQGLTSNAVLQRVKKLYAARKAGHTGSLDPLATGMLPICFGEATKFSQYLLDADKCYRASACLGIKTDTSDSTGTVIAEQKHFSIAQAELESVLSRFTGTISQHPSMFSALKHQGRPLYSYARQGIEVPRKERTVHIHQLQLEHYNPPYFQILVVCSKGTYIRNLIEDIGDALKVGAHMNALHRLYTAGFASEPMFSLEFLQEKTDAQRDALLLPADAALPQEIPSMHLTPSDVQHLYQGRVLACGQALTDTLFRLYDEKENFLGLGVGTEVGCLKAHRLVSFGYFGKKNCV